eukprot:TRINITY_DN638_c0_g2_i5.p1 TRINITY_DN638_c0_g2~~TRINITY_DN638_c0_g2_i5.p1  ORF type:complete len:265 (-),score=11.65 TRINITY_DN638_c0_g2_i5:41-835(-)
MFLKIQQEESGKKYVGHVMFCIGMIFVMFYGGAMAANDHYYSFWTNVFSMVVISLCYLLLVMVLYEYFEDEGGHLILCLPLLIGVSACSILINTKYGASVVFESDPSENDYWIRMAIFGILSIAPSAAFGLVGQSTEYLCNLDDRDPMRILYLVSFLSFAGSGVSYIYFFEDLPFIHSLDAHVWMIRILPLVVCSLICLGLRYAPEDAREWLALSSVFGFASLILALVALYPIRYEILKYTLYTIAFIALSLCAGAIKNGKDEK